MTPGWKTTEFWTTIFSKILTLLALLGFVSVNDSKTLEESLGKCVAAVFLFLANAQIVTRYIHSRLTLKNSGSPPSETRTPILPLLVLGGLGLAIAPVHAQPILPYRYQMEQRLKQLEMRPQPSSPIYFAPQFPIAEAPKQLLPIQGEPRQVLPIPGEPKQPVPIPGAPKQELPVPGLPKQELPKQTGPQAYTRTYALHRPLED